MINNIKNKILTIPLWAIVAVAILVRLAFNLNVFFDDTLAMQSDSGSYLQPAREILETGGYDSALRTPGYPGFIALIWLLTPGASIIAIILFQIMLDSVIPVFIARMKGFWAPGDGLNKIGALLYAVNPLAIYYSGKIMSEALFVFWLILSFYFLRRILSGDDIDWKSVSGAAVTSILSILTRPLGLWFYIFFFGLTLIFSWKNYKLQLSVLLGLIILSTLAWSWRNFEKSGIFTFSTASNYNIYIFGQNSYATANNISYKEAESLYRPGLELIVGDKSPGWRETPKARELGIKLLNDNSRAFIKTSFIGGVKCAFQPGWGVNQLNQMIYHGNFDIEEGGDGTNHNIDSLVRFPYFKRLWRLPVFGILLWLFGAVHLIVLYIFSVDKLRRIRPISHRLIFVFCILFFIIIAGPLGFSRFRFPAEIIMLL